MSIYYIELTETNSDQFFKTFKEITGRDHWTHPIDKEDLLKLGDFGTWVSASEEEVIFLKMATGVNFKKLTVR